LSFEADRTRGHATTGRNASGPRRIGRVPSAMGPPPRNGVPRQLSHSRGSTKTINTNGNLVRRRHAYDISVEIFYLFFFSKQMTLYDLHIWLCNECNRRAYGRSIQQSPLVHSAWRECQVKRSGHQPATVTRDRRDIFIGNFFFLFNLARLYGLWRKTFTIRTDDVVGLHETQEKRKWIMCTKFRRLRTCVKEPVHWWDFVTCIGGRWSFSRSRHRVRF